MALYSSLDMLGSLLSNWRTRAVTPLVHGTELIDLACGDNRLVRKLGFGKGVDIHDYGHADLVINDFSSLPYQDGSVDTVTILAALNYFPNPVPVLQEIRRILKDDGTLLVTLLDKQVSSIWHKVRDRGLRRVAYSDTEVRDLFEPAGLQIKEIRRFMLGLNKIYVIGK